MFPWRTTFFPWKFILRGQRKRKKRNTNDRLSSCDNRRTVRLRIKVAFSSRQTSNPNYAPIVLIHITHVDRFISSKTRILHNRASKYHEKNGIELLGLCDTLFVTSFRGDFCSETRSAFWISSPVDKPYLAKYKKSSRGWILHEIDRNGLGR